MHTVNGKNKLTNTNTGKRRGKTAGKNTAGGRSKLGLVGRAGDKLRFALSAFQYDMRGKRVLDIGSSTGGFTEVALLKGAREVVAIEKGSRQMHPKLANDKRVQLHEKTDFLTVQQAEVGKFEVILVDVSFLSLTKIMKYARIELADSDPDFLVMLKPQFEARPDQLNAGIVKNERTRREIIQNFERWLKETGFITIKKRDNELAGRHGNMERFYWLRRARKPIIKTHLDGKAIVKQKTA